MIQELIIKTLQEHVCKEAYLTGSRVKNLHRVNSDIDLIVIHNRKMDIRSLRRSLKSLSKNQFIDLHIDTTMNEENLKVLLSWAEKII